MLSIFFFGTALNYKKYRKLELWCIVQMHDLWLYERIRIFHRHNLDSHIINKIGKWVPLAPADVCQVLL